ncbi:MAG: hypothetical protein EOP51_24945 [Sphingobacteriales bacterium]|nr:MAG: hypothetical protein EOP51_24945 [Sphingobacteriales bacterium]
MTRNSMIFRDLLYIALVVMLVLPGNVMGMNDWMKGLIITIAITVRVWQHIAYYKLTGKIY